MSLFSAFIFYLTYSLSLFYFVTLFLSHLVYLSLLLRLSFSYFVSLFLFLTSSFLLSFSYFDSLLRHLSLTSSLFHFLSSNYIFLCFCISQFFLFLTLPLSYPQALSFSFPLSLSFTISVNLFLGSPILCSFCVSVSSVSLCYLIQFMFLASASTSLSLCVLSFYIQTRALFISPFTLSFSVYF